MLGIVCQKSCTLIWYFVKGKAATVNNSSAIAMLLASNNITDETITKQCSSRQGEKAVTKEPTAQSVPLNNKLGTEQEKHKVIRTAYYRLVFCSS